MKYASIKTFLLIFLLSLFFGLLPIYSIHSEAKQTPLEKKIDQKIDESDYNGAKTLLESALKDVDSADTAHLRQYSGDMGYVLFHLGQFQKSISWYEESLIYTRAQADHLRTSTFLRSIGLNYQYLGLYGLAIERYQEALDYLGLDKSDPYREAALYNSMGNLYRETQNESKSLELLHKALSLWSSLADSSNMANVMNNLGANFQQFNNLDSSLYYFQEVLNLEGLDIDSPLNLTKDMSATYNNIGVVLLQQGKIEEALPYILKSYRINQLTNDLQGMAISYNNIADYWLKKRNLKKASLYLDSAQVILQEISDKLLLVENLELRFKLLESTNQYKEALATYKFLDSLNNQLFQDEKLKVEEISNIYLLREKEFENEKISQEAALFALESDKFRQTSLFLGLLGVILVLFLFLLFRNLSRQKRLNQIISSKNETISLQQTELRHRTANTMMRLQSIIKEIARRVPDNTTQHEMVRSTQLLYAAASLERYLFSIEDEQEVPIQEFLIGLIGQHREMLRKENRAIKIDYVKSDEIVLPVEAVITISMILTEWIFNSLKFAFEGINRPRITIAIHTNDPSITIDYQDNGIGQSTLTEKGTGTQLIEKFARDLKAKIKTLQHQGTRHQLIFKASKKRLLSN